MGDKECLITRTETDLIDIEKKSRGKAELMRRERTKPEAVLRGVSKIEYGPKNHFWSNKYFIKMKKH